MKLRITPMPEATEVEVPDGPFIILRSTVVHDPAAVRVAERLMEATGKLVVILPDGWRVELAEVEP